MQGEQDGVFLAGIVHFHISQGEMDFSILAEARASRSSSLAFLVYTHKAPVLCRGTQQVVQAGIYFSMHAARKLKHNAHGESESDYGSNPIRVCNLDP